MKPNLLISVFFALSLCIAAYAGPATKGDVMLWQPDGTCFTARIRGDEYVRIKTTLDGCGIVQESDGWWCYARYAADGGRTSSGWRVGSEAPYDVIVQSRLIPYEALADLALDKRRDVSALEAEVPMLQRIRPSLMTRSGSAETVTKHGIVILAEFRDVAFKHGKEDFERLLTEEGYSLNGATGSAKEYFDDQFNGALDFEFHVSSVVKLPRNRAYYGGNDADGSDKAPAEMVKEACEKADAEIDFSLYDDDGDGVVDNVFVFFAGQDEAEGADEDCIWSHAWYIWSGAGISLTLDGKTIDRYACTSELTRTYGPGGKLTERLCGIGTFCHEYSHTFGLPDFYDTDYEQNGGWAAGLWGSTSLMDSGNQNNGGNTPPYFNAVEREILGLAEPVLLEDVGTYVLKPIHEDNVFYRLDTDVEDEYYLLECRSEDGWDEYVGGSGMLVYHVDKSSGVLHKWDYENTVNADHAHQCVDLIEADSRKDSFDDDNEYLSLTNNLKGIFFPVSGVNSLTPDGKPALKFWSGAASSRSITGIKKSGSDISFNLTDTGDISGPPVAVGISAEPFADAAIVRFESSHMYYGDALVSWGRTGFLVNHDEVSPYAPGKYAVLLEGLEPTGRTYTVEVKFVTGDLEGETKTVSFMTKRAPPVKWPSMCLGSVERNADGSFPAGSRIPLHLYNTSEAEAVEWYMDDIPLVSEGDGYHTLEKSCVLKAVVFWSDGEKDIVVKEIVVR